jgi:hypothetical protein
LHVESCTQRRPQQRNEIYLRDIEADREDVHASETAD